MGLLLDPLMADFGWGNEATSGIATAYSLASLLACPIFGVIIDRIGEKVVMTLGIAAASAGFLSLSFCHSLNAFYAAFVVVGIGYGSAYFLAATALIAKRMGDHKNLGMGIFAAAGSFGAASFAMVISWSIAHYGWRTTSVAGAFVILATVPINIFFVSDEGEPAGRVSRTGTNTVRSATPIKLILAPYFVLVTAASAFAAFGMSGINFHVVPILVKAGLSNQLASSAFGSSWVVSGIGSLAAGVVATRIGTRAVLAASLLFGALGTFALMFVGSVHFGVIAIILFVVLWGITANAINQFLPLLLVERFGPEHLAVLFGVQSALMGLVGSFAPMATGALYDIYADYRAPILISTLASLIALLLIPGLVGFLRFRRSPQPANSQ